MTTPPRATAAASLASPDASPTLAFTSAAQTALAGGSFDARTWVNKKTGKDRAGPSRPLSACRSSGLTPCSSPDAVEVSLRHVEDRVLGAGRSNEASQRVLESSYPLGPILDPWRPSPRASCPEPSVLAFPVPSSTRPSSPLCDTIPRPRRPPSLPSPPPPPPPSPPPLPSHPNPSSPSLPPPPPLTPSPRLPIQESFGREIRTPAGGCKSLLRISDFLVLHKNPWKSVPPAPHL